MRKKLTPSFCQKATAEPGRERSIYWDSALPGFGLLVTIAGHRSYVVQYRSNGRSRRMTLDHVTGRRLQNRFGPTVLAISRDCRREPDR
jgi:hypothetical protein